MQKTLLGAVLVGAVMLSSGAAAEDNAALKARLTSSLISNPNFKFPDDRDQLDKSLDTADYAYLLRRQQSLQKGDDVLLFMNWLKYRQLTGGGYVVSKLYATEQWQLGDAYQKAGRAEGEQFLRAALSTAVYAYLLTIADAPQCQDPTAPENRTQETLTQFGPLFSSAHAMPQQMRDDIVRSNLQAEAVLAPLRGSDDALCRGGMAEMLGSLQAMAASGKEPQVTHVAGLPGKTISVPSSAHHKPQFRDEAEWKPMRDAKRADLPAIAASLLAPPLVKP